MYQSIILELPFFYWNQSLDRIFSSTEFTWRKIRKIFFLFFFATDGSGIIRLGFCIRVQIRHLQVEYTVLIHDKLSITERTRRQTQFSTVLLPAIDLKCHLLTETSWIYGILQKRTEFQQQVDHLGERIEI